MALCLLDVGTWGKSYPLLDLDFLVTGMQPVLSASQGESIVMEWDGGGPQRRGQGPCSVGAPASCGEEGVQHLFPEAGKL